MRRLCTTGRAPGAAPGGSACRWGRPADGCPFGRRGGCDGRRGSARWEALRPPAIAYAAKTVLTAPVDDVSSARRSWRCSCSVTGRDGVRRPRPDPSMAGRARGRRRPVSCLCPWRRGRRTGGGGPAPAPAAACGGCARRGLSPAPLRRRPMAAAARGGRSTVRPRPSDSVAARRSVTARCRPVAMPPAFRPTDDGSRCTPDMTSPQTIRSTLRRTASSIR